MEHGNPLMRGGSSPKFITFGEIMLRLTPPNYEKIRVATSFEASYRGSEAFASGLIYAMMNGYKPMDMINFAVASSAIKHTIRGDGNITDDAASIRQLMNMNYDIKR